MKNLESTSEDKAKPMLAEVKFSVGQVVTCFKKDRMDDICQIPDDKRWNIGDSFTIKSIDTYPWGTFLNDGLGHNLNAVRALAI